MEFNRKLLILGAILVVVFSINMENPNAVFTIPYTRSFRNDKAASSLGCGYNVAYSTLLHPQGAQDALKIYTQQGTYGINFGRCQPKEVYAKIFGYAQDYTALKFPSQISNTIQKDIKNIRKVIIDWKQSEGDLEVAQNFLRQLIPKLQSMGFQTYLKVPASYLCKVVNQKSYILSIDQATKIIIEMYGQSNTVYKNSYDIFIAEKSSEQRNAEYPDQECPKFPSYTQLKNKFNGKQFFIEKTLQQEEPGYLGNQFDKMLEEVKGLYNSKIFYDAFPPNLIHI